METPNGGNGGAVAERPYRVVGYRETTDEQGNVTLWARRSPLDIQPVPVVVNVVVLKKLAALYCAIEADQQLAAMGVTMHVSETGEAAALAREFAGVLKFGGGSQ